MKKISITLLLFFGYLAVHAQEPWTDRSRALPDQLRGIATAILLFHTPNPNYPEVNKGEKIASTYVWKHSTKIRSEFATLEVVAAGSYIWTESKGWITNMKLTREEFEEQFNCPDAILKKGETYVFEKNYRYGDRLYAGDALWFVIAKDSSGKLFKGMGLIETEGVLK